VPLECPTVCVEKVFRPLFLWVSNANFICQQVGSVRCQKLIDRRVLSKQSRSRLSKPKQTASSQGVICHPMNGKPYDWRLTLIAENSGQAPGQKTTSDQINSIQIKSTQTRQTNPNPGSSCRIWPTVVWLPLFGRPRRFRPFRFSLFDQRNLLTVSIHAACDFCTKRHLARRKIRKNAAWPTTDRGLDIYINLG